MAVQKHEQFWVNSDQVYLDTATYGLPPARTIRVLRAALKAWEAGTADWINEWDVIAEEVRETFGRIIGAGASSIALLPAVSVASALVATTVSPNGVVLAPRGEFASVLYPFLERERKGDLELRVVAPENLLESIDSSVRLVATSHVQSADGRVADVEAITAAAHSVGARVYVDATHSVGTLPVNVSALHADYVSNAAYKWLCCPRGVAFLHVSGDCLDLITPLTASWRGNRRPYIDIYRFPSDLASDTRRLDVSLAWHAWVGARESLRVLEEIGEEMRYTSGIDAAGAFCEAAGLPPPAATIVCPKIDHEQKGLVEERLREASIKFAMRDDGPRLSFHVYNTTEEASRTGEILREFVRA